MAQATVSPAIRRQLDDFGDILLVLEFAHTMVLPNMLDQGLHIATHRVDIGVPGAQDTRVLTVCAASMALDDEAITDLEAALVSVTALDDFPSFTRGEVEVLFAVGTVGLRFGRDGVGELLVAVPLEINRVQTVQVMGCGSHPVGSWASH